MGGLKAKMPLTFWTFLIATLALAGIPFTSGFLSKDAILAGSLAFGLFEHPRHILLPVLGFGAAGLTAFYMFRLIFMTFYGTPKDGKVVQLAHESPRTMTVPLVILAVLSLWFWFSPNPFGEGWFHQLVQKPESAAVEALAGPVEPLEVAEDAAVLAAGGAHADAAHRAHYPAMVLSIVIAVTGILLAYRRYYDRRAETIAWEADLIRRSALLRALHNKWYFDELYEATAIRAVLAVRMALNWFDTWVIDGLVNGSATVTRAVSVFEGLFDSRVVDGAVDGVGAVITRAGANVRRIQTGRLQTYVVLVLVGVLVIMVIRMI